LSTETNVWTLLLQVLLTRDGLMLKVKSIHTMFLTFSSHYPEEVQYQEAKTKVSSTDLSDTCSSGQWGKYI